MIKTLAVILTSFLAIASFAQTEPINEVSDEDERKTLPQIESIPIRPRSHVSDEPYNRMPPEKLRRLQELNNLAPGQVIPLQPKTRAPTTFPEPSQSSNPSTGKARFP